MNQTISGQCTALFQWYTLFRSNRPDVLCKKGVLKIFAKFTRKHLCWSVFSNKVAGLRPITLLQKEIPTQVFPCEFCKMFRNTFLYRTHPVAASVYSTAALQWLRKMFRKSLRDCLQISLLVLCEFKQINEVLFPL